MSEYLSLTFPNGHSVEQVKRNAKRLKLKKHPLSTALDRLAALSLGLPEENVRWHLATKAVQMATDYCFLPKDFSFSQETRDAFNSGVVVSIDIKDAQSFTNTGPWVLDEYLKTLMLPTLFYIDAVAGAIEGGSKEPNEEDWEYSRDAMMWPTIYRYDGPSPPFKSVDEVIHDIADRNYFPPDDVWMNGVLMRNPFEFEL